MIGISSKEKAHFFNTPTGNKSNSDNIFGNDCLLLTGVLWDSNRSIDPLYDGPAFDSEKLSMFINIRPAARLTTPGFFDFGHIKRNQGVTGNIFSKEKISDYCSSTRIFFNAKDLHSSLFPANTFPGVKNSTGSSLLKPSSYSGMKIICRAKGSTVSESCLYNNSDEIIMFSVRQPGIYF